MTTEVYKPALITMNNLTRISSFTSIQAPIGAGKSRLLAALTRIIIKRHMSAKYNENQDRSFRHKHYFIVIGEPVGKWTNAIYTTKFKNQITGDPVQDERKSSLQIFADNMTEEAFFFQIMAFTSRLELIGVELGKIDQLIEPDAKIHVISERSLATDELFFRNLYDSNMVRDHLFKIYTDFYQQICASFLPLETNMIYLNTSVERCQERITTRGRKEEQNLSISYLQSLDEIHKKMKMEFKQEKPTNRTYDVDFDQHIIDEDIIERMASELLDRIIVDFNTYSQ
jgi:deoxyadenosine/deoxycytidine kinase